MTKYKTLRSYEANERRIEKARQKTIETQNAYKAVTDWKNYVLTLKTIHLKSSSIVDWNKIKNIEKPVQPKNEYKNEDIKVTVIGHTQIMKDKEESYDKASNYAKTIKDELVKNGVNKDVIIEESRVDFDYS